MVPTVYSVTAACATIDRPGSADTRASRPASRHADTMAVPHSVIDGASSSST